MNRPRTFEVTHESSPGLQRLTPVGELDIATAPDLEHAIEVATAHDGDSFLVIDLTQLHFIDSSGLHVLLRAAQRCPDRLRVINGSSSVARLFDITGVRDILPVIKPDDDPLAPLA